MKNKKRQLTTLLLGFVSLVTVLSTVYFNNTHNNVRAITQEGGFTVTQEGDNLFTVDGWGDLLIEVINKQVGESTGPLAYSLTKQNLSPREKTVLYRTDTEAPWVWEVEAGIIPSAQQVEWVHRILYASNYVFPSRLAEFGLELNDSMSLYGATQMAIWAVLEGWTPQDVVIKPEVLSQEAMLMVANSHHALFSAILAYGQDAANPSYESGITLMQALNNQPITSYSIIETDLNRPAFGQSFYRTPLLKALPNQEFGYLFQGEYAFSYEVTLEGAPEGSRVVNKHGVPQSLFSTAPGQELEFYVELPADKVVGHSGEVTVHVNTVQFRRAAPLLWSPVTETGYATLLENYFIADNASASMTVSFAGIGGVAQVVVDVRGEQVSGFEKISSPHGDIFRPVFSSLPLAGSTFEIYILSSSGELVFEGSDGEFYIDEDKLFPGFLTSGSSQTSFDVLPMDTGFPSTGYRVVRLLSTPGFIPTSPAIGELELTRVDNAMTSGTILYTTQRVAVDFGFTKLEEYFNSANEKSYRPIAGIVFGVYNVNPLGTIPANSLVGTMTSETDGRVSGSSLNLPVNQQFVIRELTTKDHLQLDTNDYFLDTTVPADHTQERITLSVTNEAGNSLETLTNFLKPAGITILRNIYQFNTVSRQFELTPMKSFGGSVSIFANEELTTLVEVLDASNIIDGVYHSSALADGRYFVKDLGYGTQHKADETLAIVDVRAGEIEQVAFNNRFKTNSVDIIAKDATNPNNIRPMPGLKFNLVLDGTTIDSVLTDSEGRAVVEFNVGYRYELIQVVPLGFNIPLVNPTIDAREDDGTFDYDTIVVNNIKTNISGNLRVNVRDTETNLAVEGIEYVLFAKGDEGFTTPLFTATTDSRGVALFDNIPASEFTLRETKTLPRFAATPKMQIDLTTLGDGDTRDLNVSLNVMRADIVLDNIETDSLAILKGGRFGLFSENNTLVPVNEFVIPEGGTYRISGVPAGNYSLRQLSAPLGYTLNSSEVLISIKTTSPEEIRIVFSNAAIVARVRIIAIDSKTEERLPGASFDIFKESDIALENKVGTVTTDSNGQVEIEKVRMGAYRLVELNTPVGFTRQQQDVRMDLSGIRDGDLVTITVAYTRDGSRDVPTIKIERPNTGLFDNFVLYIVLSFLMILLGLGIGALSLLKLSDN